MITNKGKEVIGKFLLGQAPEFASHIAVGCGAKPISLSASVAESATRQALDFEMFRIPVTARGFIKEDGLEKIVLKAELPTPQRFLISEIGLYPSLSNDLAGSSDSKIISSIIPEESWVYVVSGTSNLMSYITTNIDGQNLNGDIDAPFSSSPSFFINSDQPIFSNQKRQDRYEPPRFFNRVLLVNGNSASIDSSFNISASSIAIQTTAIPVNLGQNLPDDEIKVALSLISTAAGTGGTPNNIRIRLEFVNNIAGSTTPPKAYVNIDLTGSDFSSSRYIVISKKISQFTVDSGFSWGSINLIRLYASVLNGGVTTNSYFIAFDGIRLDNLTTQSPIFGLVGHNVLKSSDSLPAIKQENTTSYIEYRFNIGVT